MSWKWKTTLTLLLCAAAAACNRGEPESDGTAPPDGTTTLQPFAQYDLGATIREPSGIAWHAKNNSLLVVSDTRTDVYEIRFNGTLIRTIPVQGTDLEGVALSASCDTIFVVEERARQVVCCAAGGTRLSTFPADVATLDNVALEGVTVGPAGTLYVLNEKSPGMLLEYTTAGTELRRIPLAFADDYSDITYDAATNCLWIISDESKKLVKTDRNGSVLAQWLLPFTKGEGIAIVGDTVYIVNDADATLYLFRKPR